MFSLAFYSEILQAKVFWWIAKWCIPLFLKDSFFFFFFYTCFSLFLNPTPYMDNVFLLMSWNCSHRFLTSLRFSLFSSFLFIWCARSETHFSQLSFPMRLLKGMSAGEENLWVCFLAMGGRVVLPYGFFWGGTGAQRPAKLLAFGL